MNSNHLTVDIYCDEYPEPKFIGQTELPIMSAKEYTTSAKEYTTFAKAPVTILKDAKIHHTNENDSQVSSETEDNILTQWFVVFALVISALVCVGIGIACVIVALQQNEPDEHHIVKLEGNIIYVFYLGICILFCVAMCSGGALCMRCCSDFSLFCCNN